MDTTERLSWTELRVRDLVSYSTWIANLVKIVIYICLFRDSQVALVVKNPPTNAGDIRGVGSIPGSGRSPEGGNGNPLQYSCLKNPMDKGAWRATVHRIAKSQTRLKWLSTHMCICCVYVLECMWVRVCTHNIFTLVYVYIMYTHVYYIYKCTYPF